MTNQSIFIVDDDTHMALTLQYALNYLCPESSVVVARNGLEALTYIEKLPISTALFGSGSSGLGLRPSI